MTTRPQPVDNKKKALLIAGCIALVALFFLVTVTGVGVWWWWHSSSNSIVGKWKPNEGRATYEFKSNGDLLVYFPDETVKGSYTTSGKNLTVTITDMGRTQTSSGEYSVSGDEFIFSRHNSDGRTTTDKFTRVR